MFNPNSETEDPVNPVSSKWTPSWRLIGVVFIIMGVISFGIYMKSITPPAKTVDDKLATLKELREAKKVQENIIINASKAKDDLDTKIVPLKCEIYSEVGAKDTWESECRDSFKAQQDKITTQVSSQLEEEVVPDYQ